MKAILEEVKAAPGLLETIPKDRPKKVEVNGMEFGALDIRSGDTLSGLFGALWEWVYELKINEQFRRENPDPDQIKEGSRILFPVMTTRVNKALRKCKGSENETLPLVRLGPPVLNGVPDNASLRVRLSCPIALEAEQRWEEYPHPCEGVFVKRAEVKSTLYTDPCISQIKYGIGNNEPDEAINFTTKLPKTFNQELVLEIDEHELKIDGLGGVQIKIKGADRWESIVEIQAKQADFKASGTFFETKLIEFESPTFKHVVTAKGSGGAGVSNEGSLELYFTQSYEVSLSKHGHLVMSLKIDATCSLIVDPTANLIGAACEPIRVPTRELEARRWLEKAWRETKNELRELLPSKETLGTVAIMVVGIVVIIVLWKMGALTIIAKIVASLINQLLPLFSKMHPLLLIPA